jgi:hypothetical protein
VDNSRMRVAVLSARLSTEWDPVSETSCFLVFSVQEMDNVNKSSDSFE